MAALHGARRAEHQQLLRWPRHPPSPKRHTAGILDVAARRARKGDRRLGRRPGRRRPRIRDSDAALLQQLGKRRPATLILTMASSGRWASTSRIGAWHLTARTCRPSRLRHWIPPRRRHVRPPGRPAARSRSYRQGRRRRQIRPRASAVAQRACRVLGSAKLETG